MKEPKISDLKNVNEGMINEIEEWLKEKEYGACPFKAGCSQSGIDCNKLFDNLKDSKYLCPCLIYGVEATVLAFTIICDIWKVYHKRRKKNERKT